MVTVTVLPWLLPRRKGADAGVVVVRAVVLRRQRGSQGVDVTAVAMGVLGQPWWDRDCDGAMANRELITGQ